MHECVVCTTNSIVCIIRVLKLYTQRYGHINTVVRIIGGTHIHTHTYPCLPDLWTRNHIEAVVPEVLRALDNFPEIQNGAEE